MVHIMVDGSLISIGNIGIINTQYYYQEHKLLYRINVLLLHNLLSCAMVNKTRRKAEEII